MSVFSVLSIRSQMACNGVTVISPGTTRWKSTNVRRPAWRARRSCTSIEPVPLWAMSS